MISRGFLQRGSIIRKLLDKHVIGRDIFQWIFHKLYIFSIAGLNYGGGTDVDSSGERYVLKWFRKRWNGRGKAIIFDVGANIGHYTQAILDDFSNQCIIYSFEPSKEAFERFISNVNNPSVIARNIGLSDSVGRTLLYSDVPGSGLGSFYARDEEVHLDRDEEVEFSTIDEICRKEEITGIHFLKMDVEGHELMVLKGAQEMLKRRAIEVIQFEFGGCNIDSRTYFHDFWKLLNKDFHLYRILRDGLRPIREYSVLNEVFVTSNFLAVLK